MRMYALAFYHKIWYTSIVSHFTHLLRSIAGRTHCPDRKKDL